MVAVRSVDRIAARSKWFSSSRGTATAELAVILPAITGVLVLLLLAAMAAGTQLLLEEAAHSGARSMARGENTGDVVATVQRIAGPRSTVELRTDAGWGLVRVSAELGGPLSSIFRAPLVAEATARLEDLDPFRQRGGAP